MHFYLNKEMAIGELTDDYGYDRMLEKVRRACCIGSHQWHNMIMNPKGPCFVTFWLFGKY